MCYMELSYEKVSTTSLLRRYCHRYGVVYTWIHPHGTFSGKIDANSTCTQFPITVTMLFGTSETDARFVSSHDAHRGRRVASPAIAAAINFRR